MGMLGLPELKCRASWVAAATEFFWAMVLAFLQVGLFHNLRSHDKFILPTVNMIMLTKALVYTFAIWGAAASGGHLNPSITFATFLIGRTSFVRFLMYAFAQTFGMVMGYVFGRANAGWGENGQVYEATMGEPGPDLTSTSATSVSTHRTTTPSCRSCLPSLSSSPSSAPCPSPRPPPTLALSLDLSSSASATTSLPLWVRSSTTRPSASRRSSWSATPSALSGSPSSSRSVPRLSTLSTTASPPTTTSPFSRALPKQFETQGLRPSEASRAVLASRPSCIAHRCSLARGNFQLSCSMARYEPFDMSLTSLEV